MSCFFFFFFKQKTAYEMRISDWSSDVCSSDLRRRAQSRHEPALSVQPPVRPGNRADHARPAISQHIGKAAEGTRPRHRAWPVPRWHGEAGADRGNDIDRVGPDDDRSEGHTSELQSLMRISYAVFCLKKKKKHTYAK